MELESGTKSGYIEIDTEKKANFVSKVYLILFAQLLLTAVVCTVIYVVEELQPIVELLYLPVFILTLILLITLICCVKETFPANIIVFWMFTFCMSVMVGRVVLLYSLDTIIPCLGVTVVTVGGISAFCWITKKDFSFIGPYLFGGLMVLILLPLVFIFFPPSNVTQIVFFSIGVVIFVGYLFYDTSRLVNGKYQTELDGKYTYLLAAIDLYLDIINLFLYLLRLKKTTDSVT